ncbi:TRAP transporter small permease [Bacillus taeanensis]|uniref:TRAP transporter small permease n=1 Tax=Bacillus taeanensis TaxID=273032 RepID=A0A366Y0Z0_9BACI|nr:TRAP transporter small permease [Bacillus taeanensis]RBW70679.1 TRAP transporter small permease [Bacillus taeanensis]
MNKVFSVFDKALNITMALCLTIMSILVFLNVILRYAFNLGIAGSTEIARFLFIWMVFLGAIGALKDNSHLGVDLFIKKLPSNAKRVVFVISNVLVLYLLWLILNGSWHLTLSSIGSTAPATGLSLSIIYASGVITGIGMGVIVLFNLYRVIFQKGSLEDSVKASESEKIASSFHEQTKTAGEGR